MDIIQALHSRVSVPAVELIEPAPAGEALESILKAGLSVADHGKLRPWRIVLIRNEARAKLGALFAEALLKRNPQADPAKLEKLRTKNVKAPLVMVVIANIKPDIAKVPEAEQLLSAGAVASHILLAAYGLGYGGIWYTGENAYDWYIAESLGLSMQEKIVGFLYLGTPKQTPKAKERPEIDEYVTEWFEKIETNQESDI